MKLLLLITGSVCFILAGILIFERKRQKDLLLRIGRMVEGARRGDFHPETVDESMISSIENDLIQFLKEVIVSEEDFKTQKMKIQTLISDISHQTITPLSNIIVYSQLLEENLVNSYDQKTATLICKQAEKLEFLLDSLLKTSRLESGTIKVCPEKCDLQNIVYTIIEQGSVRAKEKQINLSFRKTERTVFADCDPKWTREACYNILDNAIKYTPCGGEITISIHAYTMFARIDIKDNGMGIREEEIPKIFGRFYRSIDTANMEGVGLGLYLSRTIIESQGGYIKVTSSQNVGSCFSIFLKIS